MNSTNQPITEPFRCLVVDKKDDQVSLEFEKWSLEDLQQADVTIRVEYSSLNYKDALCSSGHPGVAKTLPIIPGIDAAGTVVHSDSERFAAGDQVMVFYEAFGTTSNGGYSQIIRVPADWIYKIPAGMDCRQSMIYGTAGFTAAQCVDELQKHEITPAMGEIVVTGATGGVGIFAVKLLAKLGYEVVASTGKSEQADWLKSCGAKEVISRESLNDQSQRPLISARWSGAVDTVGGNTLSTVIRSTKRFGCVTACGMVAGIDLPITVYPFILRGVTLQGVDTAGISRDRRDSIWNRLASDWAVDGLEEIAHETTLDELREKIETILAGQVAGRVVVKIT